MCSLSNSCWKTAFSLNHQNLHLLLVEETIENIDNVYILPTLRVIRGTDYLLRQWNAEFALHDVQVHEVQGLPHLNNRYFSPFGTSRWQFLHQGRHNAISFQKRVDLHVDVGKEHLLNASDVDTSTKLKKTKEPSSVHIDKLGMNMMGGAVSNKDIGRYMDKLINSGTLCRAMQKINWMKSMFYKIKTARFPFDRARQACHVPTSRIHPKHMVHMSYHCLNTSHIRLTHCPICIILYHYINKEISTRANWCNIDIFLYDEHKWLLRGL